MTNKIDETKKQKAIEIIANEITKIPANTPMDYGTLGRSRGHTKRESEARSMAAYYLKVAYHMEIGDPEGPEEDKRCELIEEFAVAAIEKSGK